MQDTNDSLGSPDDTSPVGWKDGIVLAAAIASLAVFGFLVITGALACPRC